MRTRKAMLLPKERAKSIIMSRVNAIVLIAFTIYLPRLELILSFAHPATLILIPLVHLGGGAADGDTFSASIFLRAPLGQFSPEGKTERLEVHDAYVRQSASPQRRGDRYRPKKPAHPASFAY